MKGGNMEQVGVRQTGFHQATKVRLRVQQWKAHAAYCDALKQCRFWVS